MSTPRRSQPRKVVEIDVGGPFSRGLVYAYNHATGHDAVGGLTNFIDTGTITAQQTNTPALIGIKGAGGVRSVPNAGDRLVINSGPVTHMGVVQLTAIDANFGGVFSASDAALTGTFSLQRQSTSNDLSVYRSAGDRQDFTGAASALADGNVHIWCVTSEAVASGASTLYIDRTVYTGAGTFSGGFQAGPGVYARYFSERNANTAFGSDGYYYAHFAWNRLLSQIEVYALMANVWQLYAPVKRRPWVGLTAPAGGGFFSRYYYDEMIGRAA